MVINNIFKQTLSIHLGLSIREFERECGLKRGNISNMTGALGSDKLSKIIARFPRINLYWLLTGQGEVFRDILWMDDTLNLPQDDASVVIDYMILNLNNYMQIQTQQMKMLQNMIKQMKKDY